MGNTSVEQARVALGWEPELVAVGATDGYLLPSAKVDQNLNACGRGRCLPYPLGEPNYSNNSPQVLRSVIEHVTGRSLARTVGVPASHFG